MKLYTVLITRFWYTHYEGGEGKIVKMIRRKEVKKIGKRKRSYVTVGMGNFFFFQLHVKFTKE